MGQKMDPHGLRVGIIKDWDTQWYADKKNFSLNLKEDYELRKFIKDKYFQSAISSIRLSLTLMLPEKTYETLFCFCMKLRIYHKKSPKSFG